MRMTKLGHACVRLDKDGATIVIDPGVWSGDDPITGASGVLITHEHADHVNAAAVRAALERDAGLHLWTTGALAAQFTGFGDRVHAVGQGDAFSVAGFEVRVHGMDHATVHPDLPLVQNVGFSVDRNLFHPGDSFTIPDERVETLLLPVSAPWLKAWELFDYARAVRPRVSYAIHDAILNANGLGLIGNLAGVLLGGSGAGGTEQSSYVRLEPGTSVEI